MAGDYHSQCRGMTVVMTNKLFCYDSLGVSGPPGDSHRQVHTLYIYTTIYKLMHITDIYTCN